MPRPSASPSRPQARPPVWLQSLQMVSPSIGWALLSIQNPGAQDDATLALGRTTDGGRAWTDVMPAAAGPLLTPSRTEAVLAAAGASHAWLAITRSGRPAVTAVFGTADAGAHWAESAPIDSSYSVLLLDFSGPGSGQAGSRSAGWLVLSRGAATGGNPVRIYQSTDGGLLWSRIAQSPPGPSPGTSSTGLPLSCDKTAITFATPARGWLTGSCNSLGDALLVTHDRGRHWAPQQLPIPARACQESGCEISPPQFFGRAGFLTVGSYPRPAHFLVSSDGGATWHTRPLPAGAGVYPRIQFFDARRGQLVSAGPQGVTGRVFYATSDGGQTWTAVRQGRRSPPPGSMFDFVSTGAGFAWALNSPAPVSYATTDGGITWKSFTPIS